MHEPEPWTAISRRRYDRLVADPRSSALPLGPVRSIKGVIVFGFLVVFGLWVFSGFELIRRVSDVQSREASSRLAYGRAEQILLMVRTNVLLGSIYLRDAIIEQDTARRQQHRPELQRLRDQIETRLPAYVNEAVPQSERSHWTTLQNTLEGFWTGMDAVFTSEPPRAAAQATEFLRSRVVRRNEVLEIVDNLRTLQQLAEQRQQDETARLSRDLQQRSIWMMAIAVILGLLVAGVAFWHVGVLERDNERQRDAEEKNRQDLERLSARLVHVQEEERRSLARELHDEVGQSLMAIKMELGAIARKLGPDPGARASIDDARALTDQTLQNVRDLSQLLHPSTLDDFGLPETLRAYVRSFFKRTGIAADLVHEGLEERLPVDVEVCIYRITQEALTNVARHSGARRCTVSLTRRSGVLELVIEDDGRGIDAAPSSSDVSRGLGLIGMRERAQSLAGQFSIANRAQGGTRVTVVLPVPEAIAAGAQRAAG